MTADPAEVEDFEEGGERDNLDGVKKDAVLLSD